MKTKEQILKELVEGRKKEQNCGGYTIAGDIFYSDIWLVVQQNWPQNGRARSIAHQWLCQELANLNYYVHS